MKPPKLAIRLLATGAVVTVAALAVIALYLRYVERPWTRMGQVRANVVLLAPRVGGVVTQVPVTVDQPVRKGDLLFEIDPRAYELAERNARAHLGEIRQQVAGLEAGLMVGQAGVQAAQAALTSARGRIEAAEATIVAGRGRVAGAEAGLSASRAQVDAARAVLLGVQQQLDRADRLAKQGAGPIAVVDALRSSLAAGNAGLLAAEAGVQSAQATLDQARAALQEAEANRKVATTGLGEAEAQVLRAEADLRKAQADLGDPGDQNVRIQKAQAELATAELSLEWTRVTAPADGYVTNVTVYEGAYAGPGTPLVAFVDSGSFRVAGFFRETQLENIAPGAKATVTLMSHPDRPLSGEVVSIGWAINPPRVATIDGPSGLVPQVQPVFDWIRLAQRVPVQIRLIDVPDDVRLVAGTTASVSLDP